ncbi:MAG: DUF2851 family protein [Chlorobi bacterium]|nr:DUF2851 family protein [Chlorobiota bacterium]
MNEPFEEISSDDERHLHHAVHQWMSEPSRVHRTVSGKRLQILSPGTYNPHAGPDFSGAAILLDAMIVAGAIEFDKRRSYWRMHGHSSNPEYRRVVLHVVLDCDAEGEDLPEALVIPTEELQSVVECASNEQRVSLEEVQSFALLRLLRASAAHLDYYHNRSVREGFALSVRSFLTRYAQKRRRPSYRLERLDIIAACAAESEHARFLEEIAIGNVVNIPLRLMELSARSIANEGRHLRNELMTNSVLPSACVLASDADRIGVFTWYWSASVTSHYSILARKYPEIPQQYIWQQQGMLEMLRYQHTVPNVGDIFRTYGTLLALDFYRSAEEPPLLEDER